MVREGRRLRKTVAGEVAVSRGAWFVGASILRDVADPEWTRAPAVLAGSVPDWSAFRALYEGADDLRVPASVRSFPGGAPLAIAV